MLNLPDFMYLLRVPRSFPTARAATAMRYCAMCAPRYVRVFAAAVCNTMQQLCCCISCGIPQVKRLWYRCCIPAACCGIVVQQSVPFPRKTRHNCAAKSLELLRKLSKNNKSVLLIHEAPRHCCRGAAVSKGIPFGLCERVRLSAGHYRGEPGKRPQLMDSGEQLQFMPDAKSAHQPIVGPVLFIDAHLVADGDSVNNAA